MIKFLRKNVDMFAWQPSDMLSIDPEVMCHKLHIDKKFKPVKQKPSRADPEKAKAVEEKGSEIVEGRSDKECRVPRLDFESGGR